MLTEKRLVQENLVLLLRMSSFRMSGLCYCMGHGEFSTFHSAAPMKITDLLRMILLLDFTIITYQVGLIQHIYLAAIVGFGNMRGGVNCCCFRFQSDRHPCAPVPRSTAGLQDHPWERRSPDITNSPAQAHPIYRGQRVGSEMGEGIRKQKQCHSSATVDQPLVLISVFVLCFKLAKLYILLFWGKSSGRVEQKQAFSIIFL